MDRTEIVERMRTKAVELLDVTAEAFVPGAAPGHRYKLAVTGISGAVVEKADPFALAYEEPPAQASIIYASHHRWADTRWMRARARRQAPDQPLAIYEVHLGSWRRGPGGRWLSYRELAEPLAAHARAGGFTHVELLPVMEHPFYGSWGYQVTGYFAPTRRYGEPDDLRFLIDHLHRRNVGVILDWVPAHFPNDAHALASFDGTALFEHPDPRRGWHPDWKSCIFDYGRPEVRSFLLSSAHFWVEEMHADGLRVDAVASMLYLDYSRQEGEWEPNIHGGKENLEAISLLQELNESIHRDHPGVLTIAEESTAWPQVTGPVDQGGLGFDLKWDMGWMHDSLSYLARDPVHRRHHHNELTFRGLYAFSERFVLALSHDEVVHLKGSLLAKMPGDRWQKHANLRLLFAWQAAQPGKKLLFMGMELGAEAEWNHEAALPWERLADTEGAGLLRCVGDLNGLHRRKAALHRLDGDPAGVRWTCMDDADQSAIAFLREGGPGVAPILAVFNFTPVARSDYRVGLPAGTWREIFNSDKARYGGSGVVNRGRRQAENRPLHGEPFSLSLLLPPLGACFLERVDD